MNSKQHILNAFKEMRILNGYASIWKHHPMGVARDIDEWLLTALTEFEREIKERIKLCAKEQSCSMCMESLSQLEKEKRT